jgi:hypothetical protein
MQSACFSIPNFLMNFTLSKYSVENHLNKLLDLYVFGVLHSVFLFPLFFILKFWQILTQKKLAKLVEFTLEKRNFRKEFP